MSVDESLPPIPDSQWTKLLTPEGKAYYYNRETKETQWKLPYIFEEWKTIEFDKFSKHVKKSNWRRRWSSEENKCYYYDKETRETRWKAPQEFQDYERRLDENINEKLSKKQSRSSKAAALTDHPEAKEVSRTDIQTEDNVTKKRKDTDYMKLVHEPIIESKLSPEEERELFDKMIACPDAILEKNVKQTILGLIQRHKVQPLQVIDQLCNGYLGQPHMIHIVAEWLALANTMQTDGEKKTTEINETKLQRETQAKNEIFQTKHMGIVEDIIRSQVCHLVKLSFNKTAADELVGSAKEVPKFLVDMIADSSWRRLLIELFDSNRESVVLRWCLKQISQKGFHRVIAQGIREADYFDVFNDIMISMLVSIVSANGSVLDGIVEDLRRMCFHSDYMFLYARELLSAVEHILIESKDPKKNIKRKAISALQTEEGWTCKIRRLRQELDEAAVWRKETIGNNSESKPLDTSAGFALRFTELYNPLLESNSTLNAFVREITDMLKRNSVDSVNIQRVYSNLMGCEPGISDSIDLITYLTPTSIQTLVDNLRTSYSMLAILRQPKVLVLLVDALIHPKIKLDTPNIKTAIILSVICTLHEAMPIETQLLDIKSKIEMLLSCRDICTTVRQQLFGPSSFDSLKKLCVYAKVPVVSMALLRWIGTSLSDDDFYLNDLFFNLLPFFLQLLQEIAMRHPLQRSECFSVLKTMTTDSCCRSVNSATRISAKSGCIDVFMSLMATGFTTRPMEFLLKVTPTLETSVVQHMLVTILDGIQAPFSSQFHSSLQELLNLDITQKAFVGILSSKSLDNEWKERLRLKHEDVFSLSALQMDDIVSKDRNVNFTEDEALFE